MNIACIIHSLDGGGAERVMARLCSLLAARGHRVGLITLDSGGHDRHGVDSTVTRRPLDVMGESRTILGRVFRTRRRIAAIAPAIASEAPDVVLSFCDRTNILTLLAARRLSVPVVVSERSDPSQQRLGVLWETLRHRVYPSAAAIVALTPSAAEHLRPLSDHPVMVIPSAVERPPLRRDRSAATAHRRILAVGRLEWEKGFDRLIDAFADLATRYPEWSLRILGEGTRREALQSQIARHGLTDRVSLPGWVQPVWQELAAATLFVLPSRYEGFPSALLEAMAVGVPCVSVDCESGPRAILDDPTLGLLVANNTTALSEGIQQMILDTSLRERLGHAGTQVVDRFDWEAMVSQYEDLLRSVVRHWH